MEVKVRILSRCKECGGQAYLAMGEAMDSSGNKFTRYRPCSCCEGSGISGQWVTLTELLLMLEQSKCSHEHVSRSGGFHFSEGVVWDDLKDSCDDCGKIME